jgi:release factor glutamine methyltransferase
MADRVEVREAPLTEAVADGEEFVLVIADPPWVLRGDLGHFPEDPEHAIDGGTDGLDVARQCVQVIGLHLAEGGTALLQLGSEDQAEQLRPEISRAGLATREVRRYDGGVVARLVRRTAQDAAGGAV